MRKIMKQAGKRLAVGVMAMSLTNWCSAQWLMDAGSTKSAGVNQKAGWTLFQDPHVRLELPRGWNASFDADSTQIAVAGPNGARMVVLPAYTTRGVTPVSALALLLEVTPKLDSRIAWGAPERGGQSYVRIPGTGAGLTAVCGVAWITTQVGTATYVVLTEARQPEYRSLADTFTKVAASIRLTRSNGPATSMAAAPAPAGIRYVPWSDPNERMFSMEVPAGWQVQGGSVRRAANDVVPGVALQSPDRAIQIRLGDPAIPAFTLPNRLTQMAGLSEGQPYNYGVQTILSRYTPGANFAVNYANSRARTWCPSARFDLPKDQTEAFASANRQFAQLGGMGYRIAITAGDVAYTCNTSGREVVGYTFASTLLVQNSNIGVWTADVAGYLAARGREQEAAAVLAHLGETKRMNPQWEEMQSGIIRNVTHIVAQTGRDVLRMILQAGEYHSNAGSEGIRKVSNGILGRVDAVDPQTGRQYKLDNSADFHWIDNQGNIVGTKTYSSPGMNFRELITLP